MGTTPVKLNNATDTWVYEYTPTQAKGTLGGLLYASGVTAKRCNSYLYYTLPFPRGVTIISAKLRLVQYTALSGTAAIIVAPKNEAFSATKMTWNTRGTVSTGVTVTKVSSPHATTWEWDITAMMQSVSNGAKWYGLAVYTASALRARFYSPQASLIGFRPVLEIAWKDNPQKPTALYPSSGRAVSLAKPILRTNFIDLSGDTTMAAINVRLFDTEAGAIANTTPTFDSGTVSSSVPELDLSTTAYAGLADGATVYWRVRVQDGSGLWSAWSDYTSFLRASKGTLLVTNPLMTEVRRNMINDMGSEIGPDSTNNGAFWTSTRDTTKFRSGTASTKVAKVAASVTTAVASVYRTNSGGIGSILTGGAGLTFTCVRYVYTDVAGREAKINLGWYSGTPTIITTSVGTAVPLVPGQWTRVSITAASSGGAVYVVPSVIVQSTGGATNIPDGEVAYLDDWLLEKTSDTAAEPFSGDTPDDNGLDYSWVGAVNASASIVSTGAISDSSPPLDWTFTGRTQRAYQVLVRMVNGSNKTVTFDTGKITSTSLFATIADTAMRYSGLTYEIIVRVWDTIDREATPGDTPYVEFVRTVQYVFDGTVPPATTLTGASDLNYPWMVLNWQRSQEPDKWTVYRDGKAIATKMGHELAVVDPGTAYTFIDRLADPRVPHTWSVVAVVNGKGSVGATVTATVTPITLCLSATDGTNPVLIFDYSSDPTLIESSEVFQPAGSGPPVMITQGEHGYQGHVVGRLADSPTTSVTARQMRDRFNQIKKNNGATMLLNLIDMSMEVFIANATISPQMPGVGIVWYRVEFDFYQTDWEEVP